MTLIAEMAEALRDAVDGLDVPIYVYEGLMAEPSTPALDIYPADPFREKLSAGFGDISGAYLFTVRARVDVADNDAAQSILLSFMDDEDDLCVALALQDDQTLNGNASSVDVDGPSGYVRFAEVERRTPLLGVEWKVRVIPASS